MRGEKSIALGVKKGIVVVEKKQSISSFFANTLGAPLRNTRWSWGAQGRAGEIFLRVWADERNTVRGVDRVQILGRSWGGASAGWAERKRQIKRLREGTQGFGVECVAKTPRGNGPKQIAHFDERALLKFGPLIDEDGDIYAPIVGTVAVETVVTNKKRAGIPQGITRDDVVNALQRLATGASHPFGNSTIWDIVYGGARFPPKAVIGLAAERAAGRTLGPYDFQGGEESKCNRILADLGFPAVRKDDRATEREAEDDAAEREIQQRTDIGATEKIRLITARRGQGVYRMNLEQIEKSCRVTGITDGRYLRASHIKPWCKSDNNERIDGYNGLLLAPHVDLLFDRGWISFADDGKLLVSKKLPHKVLTAWGIRRILNVGNFRAQQCKYLAWHRQTFGFESGVRPESGARRKAADR